MSMNVEEERDEQERDELEHEHEHEHEGGGWRVEGRCRSGMRGSGMSRSTREQVSSSDHLLTKFLDVC